MPPAWTSEETFEFFKVVQNKLHHAGHGHTAAEVIFARADATKPHMGLMSLTGDRPRKSDVTIANNYLNEKELTRPRPTSKRRSSVPKTTSQLT